RGRANGAPNDAAPAPAERPDDRPVPSLNRRGNGFVGNSLVHARPARPVFLSLPPGSRHGRDRPRILRSPVRPRPCPPRNPPQVWHLRGVLRCTVVSVWLAVGQGPNLLTPSVRRPSSPPGRTRTGGFPRRDRKRSVCSGNGPVG